MSLQVREPQLPLGLGVVRIVNDAFIFGADQLSDGLIRLSVGVEDVDDLRTELGSRRWAYCEASIA